MSTLRAAVLALSVSACAAQAGAAPFPEGKSQRIIELDYAIPLADAFGMLVVAPRFDIERFPADTYQRGGVVKDGQAHPRTAWTYRFIPQLVSAVRRIEGRANMPYYIIGHSAGGQFLTRMTGFLPGEPRRIVAANPGSHLFPTRDLPFPYCFGGLPDELSDDAAIRRYLAAPLTLFLGSADTGSANLDVKPEAMKQGATRIERGRNCFRLAGEIARKNRWAFNWRLVEAGGFGHDAAKMFAHPQARVANFGDAARSTTGTHEHRGPIPS